MERRRIYIASLDTNESFVGGAGMFIQYHDVLKPVYLYAVVKMILDNNTHGLPLNLIASLNIVSLVEWYRNRRYKNPLQQLDYMHKCDPTALDSFLSDFLKSDETIYSSAPLLSFRNMLSVYKSQYMTFPIRIYSKEYEEGIEKDCQNIFKNIPYLYLHGDLKECISKCDQNYTYIFSDIEEFKSCCKILGGTYAHVLLARDYRYNYTDAHKTFKHDLEMIMRENLPIRTGTISVLDGLDLNQTFSNIMQGGT